MRQEYSAENIWILIRLHIFWKFVQNYDNACRIAAIYNSEKGRRDLQQKKEKLMEVVEAWKGLGVPISIDEWFDNPHTGELGCKKGSAYGGFFDEVFAPSKPANMNKYVHDPLPLSVDISYRAVFAYPHGIEIADNKKCAVAFNTNGEIKYCSSEEGGAFLIFMNMMFDSCKIPTAEDFHSADLTRVLDISEALVIEPVS